MLKQRTPLRTDVLDEVITRWSDGRLGPGRINESALADELGISRTPLREALLIMHQRGMLDSTMGRGFSVRPLHREEAEELYPLLATLEPLALRLAAVSAATVAEQLRATLTQMANTEDPTELQRLSQAWSDLLLGGCRNQRLLHILRDLYRHAARYEHATLERGFPVASALAHHHEIVDALVAGNVDLAATRLGATWTRCLDALLTWLPTATDATTPSRRFKR